MTTEAQLVPPDLLFLRLAGEMRQLEQDGLQLEAWIADALEHAEQPMPPVSTALQNLDRLVQTLAEIGFLFEELGAQSLELPAIDLRSALARLKLRNLNDALLGTGAVATTAASGDVDLF